MNIIIDMRRAGNCVLQPKLSVIGCQAERAGPSVTGHTHNQQTFKEDQTLKIGILEVSNIFIPVDRDFFF